MPANNRYEVTVTLPSDREIRFTRLFDWPARLLFEAWTTPEHLRHWYGCPEARLTYCEIDLCVGGAWRLNLHMPDGSDHPFHGVYREIDAPGRLVYTECYEKPEIGSPEWLTTVSFEEVDGKTRMTLSAAASLEGSSRCAFAVWHGTWGDHNAEPAGRPCRGDGSFGRREPITQGTT